MSDIYGLINQETLMDTAFLNYILNIFLFNLLAIGEIV